MGIRASESRLQKISPYSDFVEVGTTNAAIPKTSLVPKVDTFSDDDLSTRILKHVFHSAEEEGRGVEGSKAVHVIHQADDANALPSISTRSTS